MFHDIGLTGRYLRSRDRFEVDGANAARDFLRGSGIPEAGIELVWDAIALHTTPASRSTGNRRSRWSRRGSRWA